jgi:hypothetical protein
MVATVAAVTVVLVVAKVLVDAEAAVNSVAVAMEPVVEVVAVADPTPPQQRPLLPPTRPPLTGKQTTVQHPLDADHLIPI